MRALMLRPAQEHPVVRVVPEPGICAAPVDVMSIRPLSAAPLAESHRALADRLRPSRVRLSDGLCSRCLASGLRPRPARDRPLAASNTLSWPGTARRRLGKCAHECATASAFVM
jgi:hypothetical protein